MNVTAATVTRSNLRMLITPAQRARVARNLVHRQCWAIPLLLLEPLMQLRKVRGR